MNPFKQAFSSTQARNNNSILGMQVARLNGIAAFVAAVILGASAHGAAVADFGATVPTPGPNDIAQLTAGTADDTGGNYFSDKSSPPGQTFTTGSNPSGYALTGIYIKTGGYNANSTGNAQNYTLRIYSVSGSTATLISTYVTDNQVGFPDGDWLVYSGLTNILQPNTVYAYTHQRNSAGWDALSAVISSGPNLYPGGQACNIPTAGGGIVFGSSGNMDGTFVASLSQVTDPFVFPTYINPASAIGGNSVVVSAGVPHGTQPIFYQWQFVGTSGVPVKIPNATNSSYTIASVQTTNAGIYSLIVSNNPGGVPTTITNAPASLVVRAAYNIATIGTTAPTPGLYDISQLTTTTQTPGSQDGLNYYDNNTSPPGQTFTTGANPAGYTLTAIYVKTGGFDAGTTGTAKSYTLRLYSISGSTATLISTYLTDNTVGFTDGDWLRYTGMTNILQPNTVYAYTHRQNGNGYDGMSAVFDNSFAGGEACLIPQAGGAMTFSTDRNMDASFDVSMVPNGFPAIQNISILPANTAGNPVYAGTPVSLNVLATGATPLYFDWQTDNGLGGAFSDIPGSNTNALFIDTTSLAAGTYRYQVIVTNANSFATSSIVTLNLVAASEPVLVNDTTINPSFITVGTPVQFSAVFAGTLPITYQWFFTGTNGIAASISGATNSNYNISSAQLVDNGSYSVVASNAIGGAVTVSSTPGSLAVVNLGQANLGSAGIFDAGSSPPTPGAYDIAQLVTTVPTPNPLGGLNYFVDNFTPPGQTFTTGNAPPTSSGYQLSSLYLQEELSTAGGNNGANGTMAQTYTLGIYSVTGTNAVLLTSYVSSNALAITENDWIQWNGLTNVLATNSTYAFSISRNGGGWWKVGNDYGSGDLYVGGQAVSLPNSGYGAMVICTDPTIDAGFLIGLTAVVAQPVNSTPTNLKTVVSGGALTLSWPSDHIGWRLQSQTNSLNVGLRTNWVDVAGASVTNQVTLPISQANGSVFYRMVYP